MNKKSAFLCVHFNGICLDRRGETIHCKLRGDVSAGTWNRETLKFEKTNPYPCRKCSYFRGKFARYKRGLKAHVRDKLWCREHPAPWKGVKLRPKYCPFMEGFFKWAEKQEEKHHEN